MLAICAIAIAIAVALGGRSSTAKLYDSSAATRPYYSLLPAGSALPSGKAVRRNCLGRHV